MEAIMESMNWNVEYQLNNRSIKLSTQQQLKKLWQIYGFFQPMIYVQKNGNHPINGITILRVIQILTIS